jgi:hypothetical protein
MRKLRELGAVIAAMLALPALVLAPVYAAGQSSGNGMQVSPVRQDTVIEPGGHKTVTVFVRNITPGTETLQVIVDDFQASADESGTPELLLNGAKAPAHGLKQYVSLPVNTVTVNPNEQKAVQVDINIPANAAGGGYYGAVRFAPANTSGGKQVNLSGSTASLILVKVPGNITEKVSIAGFDVRKGQNPRSFFTSGKDLKAAVRFQNSGNIQEEPFGKILLKKGDTILQTIEVNNTTPRGNVLPDSIRKFEVSLNKVGSFGKYTVEGNFGYGSGGQPLSASTTFYVIPLGAIVAGIAVLIVLLFLIFGLPRIIRRHDRSVLRRAGRR